jgi:hypothetical protein
MGKNDCAILVNDLWGIVKNILETEDIPKSKEENKNGFYNKTVN